ncbi:cell wall-binding protein, partial [Clostridium saccharobutylicum]|nr:cell wall-binding protein [Clostridium saccharobutylicum]
MKKIIKGIVVILILMCTGYVQPVFASDKNLDNYIYNHLKNWDTEFEIPYYNDD